MEVGAVLGTATRTVSPHSRLSSCYRGRVSYTGQYRRRAQGREYLLSGRNLHSVPNVWTSRQECEWTSQQKYSLSLPWSPCCLPTCYAGPAALLANGSHPPASLGGVAGHVEPHTYAQPQRGGWPNFPIRLAQGTWSKYRGIALDIAILPRLAAGRGCHGPHKLHAAYRRYHPRAEAADAPCPLSWQCWGDCRYNTKSISCMHRASQDTNTVMSGR